jgi:DNA polymerase-4
MAIARKIKRTIGEKVGECLRCSIGIAPNRMLAKIAADMQKPDGLTTIQDCDLPAILHPLPLQDIPGISSAMEKRLNKAGISTMSQLCSATSDQLYAAWHSVLGRYMWHWLRGDDLPEIPTHRRTVGHSHVLPPDVRNDAGARTVMIKLIAKAAERLRRLNYWAGRMVVGVESFEGDPWEAVAPLGCCQDTLTMLEAFEPVWSRRPQRKPFRVSVTLLRLESDQSIGGPLFPQQSHRTKLAHAVDKINAKLGHHAVWYGSMHDGIYDGRDSAPTRISFTQIPELKDF